MIKLKCTCGATVKITQGPVSRLRFAEDWLTRHKLCQTGVMDADLEDKDNQIKVLERDIAFYRRCIKCGILPADGTEPSSARKRS
ncbi:MAG: hypothetical protein GY820_48370 [Gammaproteobacteria bacterium]|nr:hypothetical protein [Gammaproteobacteria bacterium]